MEMQWFLGLRKVAASFGLRCFCTGPGPRLSEQEIFILKNKLTLVVMMNAVETWKNADSHSRGRGLNDDHKWRIV